MKFLRKTNVICPLTFSFSLNLNYGLSQAVSARIFSRKKFAKEKERRDREEARGDRIRFPFSTEKHAISPSFFLLSALKVHFNCISLHFLPFHSSSFSPFPFLFSYSPTLNQTDRPLFVHKWRFYTCCVKKIAPFANCYRFVIKLRVRPSFAEKWPRNWWERSWIGQISQSHDGIRIPSKDGLKYVQLKKNDTKMQRI